MYVHVLEQFLIECGKQSTGNQYSEPVIMWSWFWF